MRNFDDNYSLVRILHAVPGAPSVDIYLDNTPLFNDLRFSQFSPYVYVPEGEYEIEVFVANTRENPIVRNVIKIEEDELVTVAITGTTDDVQLLIVNEDTETASGDNSKVRVVHLSPNAQEVNIIADGEVLFRNVGFRDITPYIQIPPKLYRVDIESSLNNTLIRKSQVNINPNRIYTFYAIGNAPNVQIVQSLDGITFK